MDRLSAQSLVQLLKDSLSQCCLEKQGNPRHEHKSNMFLIADGGAGSPILIVPNDDIEPSCGESDVLAGILSFGFQCDYESRKFLQSPNVYTKISSIISWIQTLGDGLENKVYINPDLNATCSEAGK